MLTLTLAGACAAEPVTAVRLAVRHAAGWGLDTLELAVHEHRERVALARELRVLVPDAWAGQALGVQVVGVRAGAPRHLGPGAPPTSSGRSRGRRRGRRPLALLRPTGGRGRAR